MRCIQGEVRAMGTRNKVDATQKKDAVAKSAAAQDDTWSSNDGGAAEGVPAPSSSDASHAPLHHIWQEQTSLASTLLQLSGCTALHVENWRYPAERCTRKYG
jgi:hypothetical protein